MHTLCGRAAARASALRGERQPRRRVRKRNASETESRRRRVALVKDPDGADQTAAESIFSAARAGFGQLPAALTISVRGTGGAHGFRALLDLPALSRRHSSHCQQHRLEFLVGQPTFDLFFVCEIDRTFDEDADGRVAGARSAFDLPAVHARQIRGAGSAAAVAVTAVTYDLPTPFPHCTPPVRTCTYPARTIRTFTVSSGHWTG